MVRVDRRGVRILAGVLLVAMLAGCSSLQKLRWPWRAAPEPPPGAVTELRLTAPDGTAWGSFPQYWMRNTLVIDMQSAAGSGEVVVKPSESAGWPVRLAVRVAPGRIGTLEVRGDQRLVIPVAPGGSKPVDLELSPGLYDAATPQITVRWGSESGCCVYSGS